MFKRSMSAIVIICFFLTSLGPNPRAHADEPLNLPAPGAMINLSPAYQPVIIKGLMVHKDNPFLFDFIVDAGQDRMSGEPLKEEGTKLIKYFLASLAIPDKDLWVNLSPYEKNRMVPQALGQTDMGRDLLEQDYVLKQITASLIYPEKNLGKKFWDRVYAKAQAEYGTTQIPVNTFNKVWIMADKAEVFEHNQTAFVVGAHLKVMLEEDYLALKKHERIGDSPQFRKLGTVPNSFQGTHSIASNIVRQIILPELEREVNEGQNFANLRQIFNSIILASWYKRNLKQALLNQVYANQSKIRGIERSVIPAKAGIQYQDLSPEQIYERYLKAYKKGVFNYIKEDVNAAGRAMPRKYFSGGFAIEGTPAANPAMTTDPVVLASSLPDRAMIDFKTGINTGIGNVALQSTNAAMASKSSKPITYEMVGNPAIPAFRDPNRALMINDLVPNSRFGIWTHRLMYPRVEDIFLKYAKGKISLSQAFGILETTRIFKNVLKGNSQSGYLDGGHMKNPFGYTQDVFKELLVTFRLALKYKLIYREDEQGRAMPFVGSVEFFEMAISDAYHHRKVFQEKDFLGMSMEEYAQKIEKEYQALMGQDVFWGRELSIPYVNWLYNHGKLKTGMKMNIRLTRSAQKVFITGANSKGIIANASFVGISEGRIFYYPSKIHHGRPLDLIFYPANIHSVTLIGPSDKAMAVREYPDFQKLWEGRENLQNGTLSITTKENGNIILTSGLNVSDEWISGMNNRGRSSSIYKDDFDSATFTPNAAMAALSWDLNTPDGFKEMMEDWGRKVAVLNGGQQDEQHYFHAQVFPGNEIAYEYNRPTLIPGGISKENISLQNIDGSIELHMEAIYPRFFEGNGDRIHFNKDGTIERVSMHLKKESHESLVFSGQIPTVQFDPLTKQISLIFSAQDSEVAKHLNEKTIQGVRFAAKSNAAMAIKEKVAIPPTMPPDYEEHSPSSLSHVVASLYLKKEVQGKYAVISLLALNGNDAKYITQLEINGINLGASIFDYLTSPENSPALGKELGAIEGGWSSPEYRNEVEKELIAFIYQAMDKGKITALSNNAMAAEQIKPAANAAMAFTGKTDSFPVMWNKFSVWNDINSWGHKNPLVWDKIYGNADYFREYKDATPEELVKEIKVFRDRGVILPSILSKLLASPKDGLTAFIEEMQSRAAFDEAVRWPATLADVDQSGKNEVTAILWRFFTLWYEKDAAMNAEETQIKRDMAQAVDINGGIDLNTSSGMQWKVTKDGQGVEMNINPAMVAAMRRQGIQWARPVVLKMTPVTSVWSLMGLTAPVTGQLAQ